MYVICFYLCVGMTVKSSRQQFGIPSSIGSQGILSQRRLDVQDSSLSNTPIGSPREYLRALVAQSQKARVMPDLSSTHTLSGRPVSLVKSIHAALEPSEKMTTPVVSPRQVVKEVIGHVDASDDVVFVSPRNRGIDEAVGLPGPLEAPAGERQSPEKAAEALDSVGTSPLSTDNLPKSSSSRSPSPTKAEVGEADEGAFGEPALISLTKVGHPFSSRKLSMIPEGPEAVPELLLHNIPHATNTGNEVQGEKGHNYDL